MNSKTLLVCSLVLVLISCVFFSGCSDESSTTNTTTQITSAPGSPQYVTGDIVRNPAYETAWLILGYNASSDSYQRALVYPNADGSWGYRTNSNTDTVTRAVLEKTNTEKITNKLPSSIPIKRPTVVTTPVTITTSTTGNTTSATTTITTPPTGKPTFKNIDPDYGTAGTTIAITALTGTNFQSGATVTLMMADNPNITATNVNVQSPALMTCTFNPPSDATAGAWDVVITNPDGQYVRYANEFSLYGSPNPTSTTTSTSEEWQGITSITPVFTYGNDVQLTITGTDFQQGLTAQNATMVRSTDSSKIITARDVRWDSATQVTCWFTIPDPRLRGTYDIFLIMPDGTTRSLQAGFEVR